MSSTASVLDIKKALQTLNVARHDLPLTPELINQRWQEKLNALNTTNFTLHRDPEDLKRKVQELNQARLLLLSCFQSVNDNPDDYFSSSGESSHYDADTDDSPQYPNSKPHPDHSYPNQSGHSNKTSPFQWNPLKQWPLLSWWRYCLLVLTLFFLLGIIYNLTRSPPTNGYLYVETSFSSQFAPKNWSTFSLYKEGIFDQYVLESYTNMVDPIPLIPGKYWMELSTKPKPIRISNVVILPKKITTVQLLDEIHNVTQKEIDQ